MTAQIGERVMRNGIGWDLKRRIVVIEHLSVVADEFENFAPLNRRRSSDAVSVISISSHQLQPIDKPKSPCCIRITQVGFP